MCVFTEPNRNDGMVILVDDQVCYGWSSTERPDYVTDVACRQPLSGTSVTIRTPQEFLTLCEVQIFVCSDGWFGDNCDKRCHCLDNKEVCDKITGHCSSGCSHGFLGANCQTPRAINTDQGPSSPITLAVAISCGVVILIIVLVASLWIRRLQMKIKALETTRDEPYASLDQTTVEQISETCYTEMAEDRYDARYINSSVR
ncbi:uncharacterized protein LOC124282056 [Haliotis rubra]|uniref:uncharacterized protein LOC124282056 n=1 Tax=Haliotis rubra TaxID=36100 RepID=UPI001EE52E97|nr:uncharacterized protein LOC124282056 [Haliotis rubra]